MTTMDKLNVISSEDHARIRENLKHAEAIIDRIIPNWKFEFPAGNNYTFMGLSYGVDSTVLAMIMRVKHPIEMENAEYVFTDTMNEPDSIDKLQAYLEKDFGFNITTLQSKGLFGTVEENGGFLPSPKARWCTADLKIKPYFSHIKEKMEASPDKIANTFVGIHYGERDRRGAFGIDGVEPYFPFVDSEVTRDQIIQIGTELGLVNDSYKLNRTRSGCKNCIYLSKAEHVSLYLFDKKSFDEGMSYEKIPDEIVSEMLTDPEGAPKYRGRITTFPFPNIAKHGKSSMIRTNLLGEVENLDQEGAVHWDYLNKDMIPKRKKKAKSKAKCVETFDLFGYDDDEEAVVKPPTTIADDERVVYVAVEHLFYEDILTFSSTFSAGIPMGQKLISYSTTPNGLKMSIDSYFYGRAQLAKLEHKDEEAYRKSSHIAVYAIRFPKGMFKKLDNAAGYTWFSDRAYCEVAHAIRSCTRVLEIHGCTQLLSDSGLSDPRRSHIMTDYAKETLNSIDGSKDRFGFIIGEGHYRPKDKVDLDDNIEDQDRTARCAICTL
ncbi:hypothetical protein [Vibrio barjaei]|uniref:hypothetical protein n=1 Tax=Vibrio barjaei TaxID=1676683 RepID=UPI00228408E8|nr:hypothetical protein [Vibrio barjaei]MCY9873831.1 hypothetical protein [Vibrio barjaei]